MKKTDFTPREGPPFGLDVRAMVEDQTGRFLFLRRSPASGRDPGRWEPPGGKVVPGEVLEEVLLREVWEETGLAASLGGLLAVTQFSLPAVHVVSLCWMARVTDGSLALSEEHSDGAWVTPDGIDGLDVCPALRPLIRSLRSVLAGRSRSTQG